MKWIIDNINEDSLLEDLLREQGIEYITVENRDRFNPPNFTEFCKNELVLFHGSLEMGKHLRRNTECAVYCDLQKYKCSTYYPQFADVLLNYPYSIVTYKDLKNKRTMNSLLRTHGNDGCVFVRPNSGYKVFTGKVVDIRNWQRDVDNMGFYDVVDDELVLVSEPKNIRAEWRFWIAGDTIIGSSMYQPLKMQFTVSDAVNYVEDVLKQIKWRPEGLFVIDVCQTDGEFAVVELNSFGCSGFYKVDLSTMIPAAMKFAQEIYERER